MFGPIMDILEVGIDAPKHRRCVVKFQYATSAMLALPCDCFVRCANHCYNAIPTLNFFFECFYLICIAPFFLFNICFESFLGENSK